MDRIKVSGTDGEFTAAFLSCDFIKCNKKTPQTAEVKGKASLRQPLLSPSIQVPTWDKLLLLVGSCVHVFVALCV